MAHEIESRDGEHSFFEVGTLRSAWHGLGTLLNKAPTLEEAIRVGRLGYQVEKAPTRFTPILENQSGDATEKQSALAFVTYRADTGQELGAVGPNYHVVQNHEAFRVLEPLLDEGLATLDTGGVLRNGADAWLLVQWNLEKMGDLTREVFGDEVKAYGLLANNHSGRRGILLQDTNIRVVCANTLGFAERENARRITLKHTENAKSRLVEEASRFWERLIHRYETLSEQYAVMRSAVLSEEQFGRAVLDILSPNPEKDPTFDPKSPRADMVLKRYEAKRDRARSLWEVGAGHKGDHSAWEAYNGAVEAVDHSPDLWTSRDRGSSMLDGPLFDLKDHVLKAVLAEVAA